MLNQQFRVHKHLRESSISDDGDFESFILLLGELIDWVFHLVKQDFHIGNFLYRIIRLFWYIIIKKSIIQHLKPILLIDEVFFLQS